ncbi:DUF1905 domain-containing protein [Mucilaginibacter glaciei]|uniref:DUF1905 domain-containing protein n=1 Tax=Mucilaginibacter glaciei TaxID=2772109 RepID=A0A926S6P8_9SPHI|nr:DUF1905 domain-containing protein [Mucilaginibacter glaciei]MBD1393941.1 DUF1905 domain-containing protein [Mucilaginibacter glaciei]
MKELLKNKKLILQHIPGNGSWTYHIVIPDSKDIPGKWGDIKVSGTINGYAFKNMNLAPVTGKDKRMSVNGDIRKAINKVGGDEVVVTMYKESDNPLTKESDIIDCFRDAEVLGKFKALEEKEQHEILKDILALRSEESQSKKIVTQIKKLS